MQLDDYRHRFRNIALSREDGVLDMRLHTDDGPLRWGIDPGAIHGQLADAFYAIGRDRANKVIILRGTGEVFCTDRNLSEYTDLGSDEAGYRLMREGRDILTNQMEVEAPIIGVVNGPATIHPEVPLMADIVLSAPHAAFKDSHIASNIVPGDGGQIFWTSVLGPSRASYFFLTEETLTAEDGLRHGFVHEVIDSDDLIARARELAARLAAKSHFTLRYTRMAVHQAWRNRFATESSYGFVAETLAMASKDGQHRLDDGK